MKPTFNMPKLVLEDGATLEEVQQVRGLLDIFGDCLKWDERGRVETSWGTKTPLGVVRTLARVMACETDEAGAVN